MEVKSLDRNARLLRGFVIVLAVVGILQLLFMTVVEVRRGLESRSEIARLSGEVAELEAEAARLQAVIDHGDNDAYREQLARRQGFIRPGETRVFLVRFP